MNMLEVIKELLLNFLMLLNFCPSLFLNERDVVMHSSLNSGSVEEFGVSFALLQPSDPGLLLPIYFLLLPPLLQLVVDALLLLQSSLSVTLCTYFLLEFRYFLV